MRAGLILGALLLSGCDLNGSMGQAEDAVREKLADPDSAKFRDLRVVVSTTRKGSRLEAVCGDVNAKNRMGGYSGYTPFAYIVTHTYAVQKQYPGNPPGEVRLGGPGQTGTQRDIERLCAETDEPKAEEDLNLYDPGL